MNTDKTYIDQMMEHPENMPLSMQREMTKGNPVAPLPNPGEGGAVVSPEITTSGGIPSIPLPNPGEGGAVVNPNNVRPEQIPVTPLPNPGEGGAVVNPPTGGNILPTIIGTIISTYPRPNEPCKFCKPNTLKYGEVRVLNASCAYAPFQVYVNEEVFSSNLGTGEVTEYEKVEPGKQIFSIAGDNGYIYVQKEIEIIKNTITTIAITETQSGLDFTVIDDAGGTQNRQRGSIRVCNLSYNSGELNVIFGERYVSFYRVGYEQVSDFKNIWAGRYDYYVTKNWIQPRQNLNDSNVLISSRMMIEANVSYTMYVFNWKREENAVRTLIIADH